MTTGLGSRTNGTQDPRRGRFVHNSHVFASAVREFLEARLLREISPLPLSPSQFHLLKLMTFNGRHQAGEIAALLGVSAPAATKTIDKLQRFGLLHRRHSRGDRRATLLSVSPAGRAFVARFERLRSKRLAHALQRFDPEDLDDFTRLLERFSICLIRRESLRDGTCLRCAADLDAECAIGGLLGGCPYQNSAGASRCARRKDGARGPFRARRVR